MPELFRAHRDPHGRPPLADGDTVPCPPRPVQPALTRRQWIYGWICAGIVLAALAVGIAREIWW